MYEDSDRMLSRVLLRGEMLADAMACAIVMNLKACDDVCYHAQYV